MKLTTPPTRYVNDSYHPTKKPLRCILGFHKWSPWRDIPGSDVNFMDWYWTWQMQRTCKCCNKTEEEWK